MYSRLLRSVDFCAIYELFVVNLEELTCFLTVTMSWRCQHPNENWLCLCCKDVLCSRFVNKHMLEHYHQSNHCLALSYRFLRVSFPFICWSKNYIIRLLFLFHYLTWSVCGLYLEQWFISVVFLMWCLSRRSSDIVPAPRLRNCVLTEIWWSSTASELTWKG